MCHQPEFYAHGGRRYATSTLAIDAMAAVLAIRLCRRKSFQEKLRQLVAKCATNYHRPFDRG
jgi:hypothetical protein